MPDPSGRSVSMTRTSNASSASRASALSTRADGRDRVPVPTQYPGSGSHALPGRRPQRGRGPGRPERRHPAGRHLSHPRGADHAHGPRNEEEPFSLHLESCLDVAPCMSHRATSSLPHAAGGAETGPWSNRSSDRHPGVRARNRPVPRRSKRDRMPGRGSGSVDPVVDLHEPSSRTDSRPPLESPPFHHPADLAWIVDEDPERIPRVTRHHALGSTMSRRIHHVSIGYTSPMPSVRAWSAARAARTGHVRIAADHLVQAHQISRFEVSSATSMKSATRYRTRAPRPKRPASSRAAST